MTNDLKSAVVKFQGGFYRVTSHKEGKVNLSGVRGGRVIAKGIPEAEVVAALEVVCALEPNQIIRVYAAHI